MEDITTAELRAMFLEEGEPLESWDWGSGPTISAFVKRQGRHRQLGATAEAVAATEQAQNKRPK